MESNDEMKVQILLSALQERYNAMHAIRQRVENICVWILGIFVVIAGWIVQGGLDLYVVQRIFLSIVLLVAVMAVRLFYLRDIEKGFRKQLQVAARIEKVLGLYEGGYFEPTETGLYPEEWSQAGTESGTGHFFEMSYRLLYIGTVILITAIMLHNCVL